MIGRTQAKRAIVVRNLRRIAWVLALAYGVSAITLAGIALTNNRDASLSESEASASLEASKKIRIQLAAERTDVGLEAADSLKAIGIVQQVFEREAKRAGCAVVEYRSASEVLPYLTRFAKTTSIKGWNQVESQVTISGRPRDVMKVLTNASSMAVPFEFDSIEVSREKVNEAGEATVFAHATFRVLIRQAS